MASGGRLLSVDFEIFGTVQGVFFRKNTAKTAKHLQLVGWVRNTRRKTVEGQVQGAEDHISQMKHWLEKVGSKNSKIVKAVFTGERVLDKLTYKDFTIKK